MEKVNEIQIVPIKPLNGLVGFVSFVYDNNFYIGSIGIYTRPQGGYRLAYPTRKNASGISFNIVYPIKAEISKQIEQLVADKFENVMTMYDRHDQIGTK